MSDIKNLIKAKSHDPYREFEIVSYLMFLLMKIQILNG